MASSLPLPAVFQHQVDGTGPGTDPAGPISLWSRPSTTTGCEIARCWEGTERTGRVEPPDVVRVSCVTRVQRIRNGVPGGPGYFEDDRWLLVTAGQAYQQRHGGPAYLSNVWYARAALPADLAVCPDPAP